MIPIATYCKKKTNFCSKHLVLKFDIKKRKIIIRVQYIYFDGEKYLKYYRWIVSNYKTIRIIIIIMVMINNYNITKNSNINIYNHNEIISTVIWKKQL